MISDRRKPEYSIDEKVEVVGWTGRDTGTIIDIKWIYHIRAEEHTWGYNVRLDHKRSLLSMTYIPEGYLRKYQPSEPVN